MRNWASKVIVPYSPYLIKFSVCFFVEGPDDVNAFNHIAHLYKAEGKIDRLFDELGVVIVCIGGCDSIKHWTNLNIIRQLSKPFFILLDSDKQAEMMNLPIYKN